MENPERFPGIFAREHENGHLNVQKSRTANAGRKSVNSRLSTTRIRTSIIIKFTPCSRDGKEQSKARHAKESEKDERRQQFRSNESSEHLFLVPARLLFVLSVSVHFQQPVLRDSDFIAQRVYPFSARRNRELSW